MLIINCAPRLQIMHGVVKYETIKKRQADGKCHKIDTLKDHEIKLNLEKSFDQRKTHQFTKKYKAAERWIIKSTDLFRIFDTFVDELIALW